jgi:hypothetical protein
MSPKPHRRPRPAVLAEARSVRRLPQPQDERQVDHRVEEDAVGRSEDQQDAAAHRRPQQQAEVAPRRVQPDGALQLRRADDLMEQELRCRSPQDAGEAVHDEDRLGLPHLQRVGDEEEAPGERGQHEEQHAELNDAARIEAIGERARVDREQQERQPVRQDGEAAQRRRLKLLEHDPIADHVLDAVSHHRQRRGEKEGAKTRVAQRGEGLVRDRVARIVGLNGQIQPFRQ